MYANREPYSRVHIKPNECYGLFSESLCKPMSLNGLYVSVSYSTKPSEDENPCLA